MQNFLLGPRKALAAYYKTLIQSLVIFPELKALSVGLQVHELAECPRLPGFGNKTSSPWPRGDFYYRLPPAPSVSQACLFFLPICT